MTRAFAVALGIVVTTFGPLALCCRAADSNQAVWIRVNQVGYLPADPKIAVLASDTAVSGRFTVGDISGDVGRDCGAYGPFRHTYRLDFTRLNRPGTYTVRWNGVASLAFPVGPDCYRKIPSKLMDFMHLQRCGSQPAGELPCHLKDAIDTTTGAAVDLIGGWHDAADRIKHMITTSYCVAALSLAGEAEEAQYGATFLKKIHPRPDLLYVQVGDDRDHQLPFSCWSDDPTDYGWGKGGPRAAWQATGKPEGPKFKNASTGKASLAGRCAAAMALTGNVAEARSFYSLALRSPGCAQSVPVRAPYYYGERTYHDDLEWGAVELYAATHDKEFLTQAVRFAHMAHDESWMGKAYHGHYEYFPYVNLAHWRLYSFVDPETKSKIATYYRNGLEEVRKRAEQNAFRMGTPLVWCSVNDVIAFATQSLLYEKMTGDTRYRSLATEARDWIFGRNPWGVSMVLGVPAGGVCASKPHHMHYKVLNRVLVGGLVDGPVSGEINAGLKFAKFEADPFARFQSDLAVYHDDWNDFSTNEPIIDGTVSLLLLLTLWN